MKDVLVFMEIDGVMKCGKYSTLEEGTPDKLIEEVPFNGIIPVGVHYFAFKAENKLITRKINITNPSHFTKI